MVVVCNVCFIWKRLYIDSHCVVALGYVCCVPQESDGGEVSACQSDVLNCGDDRCVGVGCYIEGFCVAALILKGHVDGG